MSEPLTLMAVHAHPDDDVARSGADGSVWMLTVG